MARDKQFDWRMEGMYYAYEQIKKNGLEEFEKELKFRQASGVKTISKTKKELDEYQFAVASITMLLAVSTLYDEFDFDADACVRFVERLRLKIKSLAQEDITWEEQQKIVEDEVGVRIVFKE